MREVKYTVKNFVLNKLLIMVEGLMDYMLRKFLHYAEIGIW